MITIFLDSITKHEDIWGAIGSEQIKKQLNASGFNHASPNKRFKVKIMVFQGQKPNYDIDNYAKQIMDTITNTQCVWKDDSQVDNLCVDRKKDISAPCTSIQIKLEES